MILHLISGPMNGQSLHYPSTVTATYFNVHRRGKVWRCEYSRVGNLFVYVRGVLLGQA